MPSKPAKGPSFKERFEQERQAEIDAAEVILRPNFLALAFGLVSSPSLHVIEG
jgi:hypothetical protein